MSTTPSQTHPATSPMTSRHDEAKKALASAAVEASSAMANCVKSDFALAAGEFQQLETMNLAIRERYSQMSEESHNLIQSMAQLQDEYGLIEPYIHQIFEVERQITVIESVALELDDYTKRLEESLKRRGAL
ncbi:biogenesis of lysosome-related organelles complex-1 subunit 2-domain-containing protein [Polychytrium aggregatum]|uniref:biogenesis of lysosome-related organelles complex-1 subunit 2-domain-containing protein n=1 Tax=Polychytrium aggregatum TaxID=110093 RepID=UPI0022FEEB4B|nr:biogenesis of lysosome-related organelles complex-1 subunit 2-domain-containing protein [Polychytrium aggregatum]KAI9202236.1 biogenesis of lysosome-related organelles complex-1 subunit 2-domain-containing protein [Polychytrium aggregatum]